MPDNNLFYGWKVVAALFVMSPSLVGRVENTWQLYTGYVVFALGPGTAGPSARCWKSRRLPWPLAGVAVGPGLMGYLYVLDSSYRLPYLFAAGAGVLACFVFVLGTPRRS